MAILRIIRRGKFPVRRLRISIDNKSFFLKGNDYKEINLPQGDYNFTMKMDWWKSANIVSIDRENNKIVIDHYLPDLFYLLGIVILTILALLTYFFQTNIAYISISIILFILPQIYFYIMRYNKYFMYESKSDQEDPK